MTDTRHPFGCGCSSCPPSPEPDEFPGGSNTDPALRSLSDALRVSFRLLSAGMVLFVALFLATGIGSISPQERGLVKVLGKITRVAKEGFVYNWPFPIGEIETVSIQERQIRVEDFWLYETPQDKLKDLASRSRANIGLRPGWDGYLLTGDRNLIHVKFLCRYQVQDPVAVRTRLADLESVLRDILCRAAVQAGATRTADALQADPTGFLHDVRTVAQAELDALLGVAPGLPSAVRVNSVLCEDKTWPLGAYTAYERAQKARTERSTRINKAVSEARDLTKVIVEESLLQLVGRPWNRDSGEEARLARLGRRDGKPYNLIGHLSWLEEELRRVESAGPSADAETLRRRLAEVRAEIESILTRPTAQGEVQNIISDAYAKKTAVIQQAQKQADAFRRRRAQYVKAPEMFLESEWAGALDDIFNAPTNAKYYLNPGGKGNVVYISRDPAVMKEIRDYLRQKKNEETK